MIWCVTFLNNKYKIWEMEKSYLNNVKVALENIRSFEPDDQTESIDKRKKSCTMKDLGDHKNKDWGGKIRIIITQPGAY